jgi:molybdopterin-synthase adenylyltransferase
VTEDTDRYDRQIALFGAKGQSRIATARVGIVGLGGLGSHMAQQLAYLGVTRYALIDGDRASTHSFNRLVTGYPSDHDAYKTDLAERLIRAINPEAVVVNIRHHLQHPAADAALDEVDLILGGLDNDAARLRLTDLASQRQAVYIDAATDIDTSGSQLVYGGRVVAAGTSPGCLFCLNLLDQRQIRLATMNPAERAAEAAIYGVPVDTLEATGPSVITLNGVVASLAATEAMVHLTRLRSPQKQLTYRGDEGGVRVSLDQPSLDTCPYCARWSAS